MREKPNKCDKCGNAIFLRVAAWNIGHREFGVRAQHIWKHLASNERETSQMCHCHFLVKPMSQCISLSCLCNATGNICWFIAGIYNSMHRRSTRHFFDRIMLAHIVGSLCSNFIIFFLRFYISNAVIFWACFHQITKEID